MNRPNFVFVVADDLGNADLGCYGGRDADFGAVSPVLDGIAARGLRFTQGYANSPVCPATRFALHCTAPHWPWQSRDDGARRIDGSLFDLAGGKMDLTEGGIRVPYVAQSPSVIAPGGVTAQHRASGPTAGPGSPTNWRTGARPGKTGTHRCRPSRPTRR